MPPTASTSQTEFVASEFRTSVSDADVDAVLEVLSASIERLRTQIEDDDLDDLVRGEPGPDQLTESHTRDRLQPEPFTQDALINPLLEELGYNTDPEASTYSDERGQRADYSVSLRHIDEIESTRLLIEAEPINKKLESRGHGINQVESWLKQRDFESDFGFATDGFRWVFIRYDPDSYTHNRIADIDLSGATLTVFERLVSGDKTTAADLTADQHEAIERFVQTFKYDNFVAIASQAHRVIRETQKEITDEFYEDYIRKVFGVVREGDEERAGRSLIGDGVIEPERCSPDDTRLFSVKVMNRLIFVKFLEDKQIVDRDLLETLKVTYEQGMYPESLYKTFIEKLFFDVMNSQPSARPSQIKNIELFEPIPYLNGGLFRPYIGEDKDVDERAFDIHDSVLISIIDLLEEYTFSADGGPTDLDPSVLGNVFEKTINYITTDVGDKNKQLGAYYTPSEITRFCAERTIRPALLDRFKSILQNEHGWEQHELEGYDSIYELIEDLPDSMSVIGTLLDEANRFRVVDPAVGSGHFLTSVLEEVTGIRQALYAQHGTFPHEYRLKKTTVQNNIYGVDIVGPAVEIAKLRCWLSIIAELSEEEVDAFDVNELALPNIAFNLRQGNSLIGYTGFPESTTDGEGYTLRSFSEDSVRSRYKDIIDQIDKYEEAGRQGFTDKAEHHRERAFDLLNRARDELLPDIHQDFIDAGVDDFTTDDVAELTPFNWVLEFAEVYADGGFDVVVGNPPWDVLRTNRDDFFSRYDPTFRARMPNDKDETMESLLEDSEIAAGWEQYNREMQGRADYFNNAEEYDLQSPTVDGKEVTSENELSALFLERAYKIAREDAYVSLILPNVIFTSSTAKDLRLHLLDNTTVDSILHFENHGIFDGLHNQYRFGILTFMNSGRTDSLRAIFLEETTDVIDDFEQHTVMIPRQVLVDYSPEAALFPQVSRRGDADPAREVNLLRNLLDHPSLDETVDGAWNVRVHRELDRTYDADRFVEAAEEGDYPVLGGKNIYQFVHDDTYLDVEPPEFWSVEEVADPELSAKRRIRDKEVRNLKTALYQAFEGTGSQKQFVDDLLEKHRGKPLTPDDVLLDSTTHRLAFRDIGNTTNERTFIATVLPEDVVCHSKLRMLRPHRVAATESDLAEDPLRSIYEPRYTDEELFVALGLLNSLPFDYLMRTKIDNTLVEYKVRESQVPRLTDSDEWFEYIWTRAARLNCYGEAFASLCEDLEIEPVTTPLERKAVQAEIDAAAMHAYGLERPEVEHLIDNFGQVESPRMMDEAYFNRVLEVYGELST